MSAAQVIVEEPIMVFCNVVSHCNPEKELIVLHVVCELNSQNSIKMEKLCYAFGDGPLANLFSFINRATDWF